LRNIQVALSEITLADCAIREANVVPAEALGFLMSQYLEIAWIATNCGMMHRGLRAAFRRTVHLSGAHICHEKAR
jgi:hypothetical protein